MSDAFLADTQKRLWRLIAWPEGVRAGLHEEAAGVTPLASLITSDERLSAEDRLDVYANAYFYRIHDVLAETFPTLAHLLGEDAFHDLITSYLAVCPSRHPSLRFIGSRLSGFLADHEATASFRERFPWGADLAAFEASTEDVFDAADSEAASREQLASIPAEDWDALVVRLRPSVRLLQVSWPVHSARHALRSEEPTPSLSFAPVFLCLWRRDEQVVHRELGDAEARALEHAAAGIRFGLLCEEIAQGCGEESAPARAAAWLGTWIDDGLLLPPPHAHPD
jgi:hypothetical protein